MRKSTRDILMSIGRKMTILTITMFNENVHTGCLFYLTCRLQKKVIRGTGRVLGGTGGPNQANLEA